MFADMPVDIRDTVGRNIKAEMARAGATQADIANLLGLSQPQVSRRLTGEITLTITEIEQIARFLEVSVTTLINGGGPVAESVTGDKPVDNRSPNKPKIARAATS